MPPTTLRECAACAVHGGRATRRVARRSSATAIGSCCTVGRATMRAACSSSTKASHTRPAAINRSSCREPVPRAAAPSTRGRSAVQSSSPTQRMARAMPVKAACSHGGADPADTPSGVHQKAGRQPRRSDMGPRSMRVHRGPASWSPTRSSATAASVASNGRTQPGSLAGTPAGASTASATNREVSSALIRPFSARRRARVRGRCGTDRRRDGHGR